MLGGRKILRGAIIAILSACFIITTFDSNAVAQDPTADETYQEILDETAETDKDFGSAFYALKRDERLQFEIEDIAIPDPEEKKEKKPKKKNGFLKALASFFAGLGSLAVYVFWGGAALIVALILFFIFREVLAARFLSKREPTEEKAVPAIPLYKPDEDLARVLLDDVDRLAAEGRFEDAVHTLLHRSIQDIDIRRPNTIKRSLTSREIAGLEILTPLTRDAFSSIAKIVETSFFGGREIGKSEFTQCREAYASFIKKTSWMKST